MKALVYLGDGKKAFQEKPKPKITAPTDAIVRLVKTTICGTDLHILKGDLATAKPGLILGHEGVGVIDEAGSGVTSFKRGDRVLISCVTSCGTCAYCRKLMFSHCVNGGWILGNLIDGTQTEFVRIPYADTSLYPILEGENEEPLVLCSDILPTGFELRCPQWRGWTREYHRYRRLGTDRTCRPAYRPVLFTRRDHHDRP